ncbi:superoxide dismutase [Salinibacillus xinjiangensis]|uniref:superoxide dismutase n=1 Tax=Salinibacillus xinjiangensis TaxID=1229268 RepID=A0A6G1X626_9BACI|nr:superoxide dismutase [Salinibacillus xinjiangensis]MRG86453.1 superoxide dismutase [Salinibacillus xinjiangensis]
MNPQTKQYLHALLNWAEEVESKIKATEREVDFSLLEEKMTQWKEEINHYLEEDKDISQAVMGKIQENGQNLLDDVLLSRGEPNAAYVPVGEHKLPPLPYPYDALEPVISEEIMRLHHDVHHKGYVDGLNKAEKMIDKWSESQNGQMLRHWMREQSFNGSGHFLHSIFWENMSPDGGGNPNGILAREINKAFGSFNRFKQLFSQAAKSVQGTGWAMLVWELQSGRLAIQSIEKHNMYALWDVIPLLVLDVWEHAYYLQYQTDKGKYVDNWWQVVNWDDALQRLKKVKT